MKKFILLTIIAVLVCSSCQKSNAVESKNMNTSEKSSISCNENGTMTLIGHASVKIKTDEGIVIYIDPFYKGDYTEPADIILVTHNHDDHNQIKLITQKENTQIIDYKKALQDGKYNTFDIDGIGIEATEAYNKNHKKDKCVGFIITLKNNIKIYHAGDTDITEQMKNGLAAKKITYAMFPSDGIYNMNAKTATEAANLVKAKYSIPIHTSAGNYPMNKEVETTFTPKGALIVQYGETIRLK